MNPNSQSQFNTDRKAIKVLFISHESELVGAERSLLLLLLENIDRKRFEPIVILPTSGPLEDKIYNLGIKIYTIKYPWWLVGKLNLFNIGLIFGYKPIQELLALLRIIKIIKNEQIDIVYTNTIVVFSGAISAHITKTPHIWHVREIIPNNTDLHFFLSNKILFHFVTKLSNTVITISQAVADQFLANHCEEKITIIPNAVDLCDFNQSKPLPHISRIKTGDWLVAVIGSFQKRKAQDIAIKSIKIAKEQIPEIKLILIGDGNFKMKNYLTKLVSELGLSDEIVFAGFRTDVPQILPHCKVLLMPSYDEPFGRVTIEAMAAGIPVIGTNSGGTKEIVQEGITGYLVSPKNPTEIAEKIIQLYENPDLIQKLGNAGKNLVMQKYTADEYAKKKIESLIEEIVFIDRRTNQYYLKSQS